MPIFEGTIKDLPKATRNRESVYDSLEEWLVFKQRLMTKNLLPGEALGMKFSKDFVEKTGLKTFMRSLRLMSEKFIRETLKQDYELRNYKAGDDFYIVAVGTLDQRNPGIISRDAGSGTAAAAAPAHKTTPQKKKR